MLGVRNFKCNGIELVDGDKITLTPVPPLEHPPLGKISPLATWKSHENLPPKLRGSYFSISPKPQESEGIAPLKPPVLLPQQRAPLSSKQINVWVNGKAISIDNNPSHAPLLADALRFVQIDTSSSAGKKLYVRLNGQQAFFTSPLEDGAKVEVFFE